MKITQTIMSYGEGRGILLTLDDEELTIDLVGTVKNDFEEHYASLGAMEKAYKKRIAPYLKRNNCYDTDRNQKVEIIADLAAFFVRRRQSAVATRTVTTSSAISSRKSKPPCRSCESN